MNIDVYNTHIEVYPYKKDDIPIIEDMYTATDKFTNTKFPCGYLIDNDKLYLPRGTSISRLEHLTGKTAKTISKSDPSSKMTRKHYGIYDPRDKIQEKSIKFLEGADHQLALNLKTGLGKTFCVAYASSELQERTIIITPNESLKQQWIKTYRDMFEYRSDELCNISGSAVIEAIMLGTIPEANVYFVNHQTLHSYLSETSGYQLHKFFKKIKVGIKVYDESHLDFGNILLMDFFSNTNRTWYLTATFDRSDKTESVCFKRAFQSVISYGENESAEVVRKHVIYHVVNINSHIDQSHKAKLMGYPGFTAGKYGNYAIFEDKNNTMYNTIFDILKKTKNLEGKTLIFLPLISCVDEVVEKLKKDFPEKTVAAYHSKVPKDEKEEAEKKDIIVSTVKSCGTGRDIKGLRVLICGEPVVSKVVIEQMIGRLRPYAPDKDTYYWDIVDRSIPPLTWWFRARYKKIPTLVKQIVSLDM